MDMSALDHNTNGSEDDESQAKLVLVATPNGFPSSLFSHNVNRLRKKLSERKNRATHL